MTKDIEDDGKLKDNPVSYKGKNGGARPGSGRPKGSMNYKTKKRLAIKQAFENRILHSADILLSAALNKALGESYLYHRHKVGSGNKERTETEIVTDPQTIKDYLDGLLDELKDSEYYYISTKPVDMVAVKELYDRAFGKSKETVETNTTANTTVIIHDEARNEDAFSKQRE
jgi:hypothetical protein